MSKWSADISNDPNADFRLYIELCEDQEARACVRRDPMGQLELCVYEHQAPIRIPADFLRTILISAERDLE